MTENRTPITLLATLAFAWGVVAPAAALTGREIIDSAQKKNGFATWRDRTSEITMESYSKSSLQRTREASVSEQTDPRGEHRTFMEFTAPNDVTGSLFLHLSPRNDADQQWLWTPASRKARRLSEGARDENFFGTDLSYRDLELLVRIQQWNEDESTATLQAEESLDGKPCHVVELVPKNKEFPYTKYRLWFGKDDLLLWRTDIYGEDGALFRRVVLKDYDRIQNYAIARHAEIATLPFDTRTLITVRNVRYDSGVSDDVFSVSNVQKGR